MPRSTPSGNTWVLAKRKDVANVARVHRPMGGRCLRVWARGPGTVAWVWPPGDVGVKSYALLVIWPMTLSSLPGNHGFDSRSFRSRAPRSRLIMPIYQGGGPHGQYPSVRSRHRPPRRRREQSGLRQKNMVFSLLLPTGRLPGRNGPLGAKTQNLVVAFCLNSDCSRLRRGGRY